MKPLDAYLEVLLLLIFLPLAGTHFGGLTTKYHSNSNWDGTDGDFIVFTERCPYRSLHTKFFDLFVQDFLERLWAGPRNFGGVARQNLAPWPRVESCAIAITLLGDGAVATTIPRTLRSRETPAVFSHQCIDSKDRILSHPFTELPGWPTHPLYAS